MSKDLKPFVLDQLVEELAEALEARQLLSQILFSSRGTAYSAPPDSGISDELWIRARKIVIPDFDDSE
jgi:hypothetical protein